MWTVIIAIVAFVAGVVFADNVKTEAKKEVDKL